MKGKLIFAASILVFLAFIFVPAALAQTAPPPAATQAPLRLNAGDIGFQIPNFQQFMSFLVKFFFVLAGLLALFYMLWGALSYVTSGGDKEATGKAQQKIIAAVVGVILIIATLAIIAGLEQLVFKGRLCFGVTCELKLPTLLKCPDAAGSEPDGNGKCPGESGYIRPPTTDAGSPNRNLAGSLYSADTSYVNAEFGIDQSSTSAQPLLPATGF